jgi:DNA-binding NarL/FixJ family response regulator
MSSALLIGEPSFWRFFPTSQTYGPDEPERRREPRPQPRTLKPQAKPGVKSILIVDDHEGERRVIRAAVEGFTQYEVCGEAGNGTEAISRAKTLKPDLIIMDLAMPLMNGLEAASVLKNEVPGVCVVLFTLYSDLVRGPRSSMFGVTVVLSKEHGLAPLLDCLNNLLGPSGS